MIAWWQIGVLLLTLFVVIWYVRAKQPMLARRGMSWEQTLRNLGNFVICHGGFSIAPGHIREYIS